MDLGKAGNLGDKAKKFAGENRDKIEKTAGDAIDKANLGDKGDKAKDALKGGMDKLTGK